MKKLKSNQIEEDPLIEAIVSAKGRRVEIIAFGILYVGILKRIDIENGIIQVVNGEDQAILEIERIESFCLATL